MDNTQSAAAAGAAQQTDAGYATTSSAQAREQMAGGQKKTIGELVATVTAQFSALIRDEFKYAQTSLTQKVKNLGIGGGLFAVAGILALYLLLFLLLATAAGFTALFGGRWWAGFLATAGVLLLIIAVLGGLGAMKFKKSGQYKADPVGGVTKDVNAFKKGLSK